jgi:pyridoxine 4-dehydrogenase
VTNVAASGWFAIAGDLEVNRLGFGAMRITGPGIWGPPAHTEEARRVLRRAVELGTNLIDTADSYGPEVSEELIAQALAPYPAGLVVATKGGLERTGPSRWPRNGRPEHLRRACEGSLRRLGLERIDLYQLHAPDPAVPYVESVGTLRELRDEGKIRHVGVSNVSLEQLAVARGVVEVASVQNRFGLTDRASADVLAACERDGIAFLPWAPLERGMPAADAAVREIAERHGTTPFGVAIAWLLHVSPVVLPIPGTSSVAHLEENVAAAALAFDADELARLDALGSPIGRQPAR